MAEVNLSPYTAQSEAIARRLRMAEALNQQAMQPMEMPTVPGAKVSHYAGLAKMLQAYNAGQEQKSALQEQKDLVNKTNTEATDWIANYGGIKGTPNTPEQIYTPGSGDYRDMGMMGQDLQVDSQEQAIQPAQVGVPTRARTPEEQQAYLGQGIRNPLTSAMASALLTKNIDNQEFQNVLRSANMGNAPMGGAPTSGATMGGAFTGRGSTNNLDPTALAMSGNTRALQLAAFLQKDRPEYGTKAEIFQKPDGSLVERVFGNGGEVIERPVTGKPYEKPLELPEQVRTLSAAIANAGIDPNSPQGKAIFNAQIAKLVSHPEANKNITNVAAFLPASEEAQRDFMKSTRTTYDQLKQAPALLANIDEAKKLIPNAKQFMGPGGEPLLNAAKLLNNRLGTNIATEGITDAETLRTRIFFNIMDNLKKMDASPSQNQQAIMQESLGNLGTDPNALPKILDAYADSLRQKILLHNDEVKGAIERGVKFPYSPIIKLNITPGRSNW